MAICANTNCDSVWFGSGWQIEMPTPPHRFNGYLSCRPYKVYARKKYCTKKCERKVRGKKWNDYLRVRPTDPNELERWLVNKAKQLARLKKNNAIYRKKTKQPVIKEFVLEKTLPNSVFVPKAFFIDPKYRESLGYDFGNIKTSGFYSAECMKRKPYKKRTPGSNWGRPKKLK